MWQAEIAEKQRVARRLRDYRLDPRAVESGKLIAYVDIVSEHGSISSGGRAYAMWFEHGGVEYLVNDLYCPNPDCDCDDVHLAFFRDKPTLDTDQGATIEECFVANVSLKGRVKSVECFRVTRSEASAVLKTWRDSPEFAEDLESFQWRYGKIKEIAARSYSKRHLPPPEDRLLPPAERLSSPPRVGRNEPCPCGSGKKYKKCCGKSAS